MAMNRKLLGHGLWIGAALALSLAGALWLWHMPARTPVAKLEVQAVNTSDGPRPERSDTPPASPPAPQAIPEPSPSGQTPSGWHGDPFTPSLAGTRIDGHLRSDEAGNLIVELEVRDFFDYFLNTVGEVSPEEAIAQIERMARDHLPPQAAEQALALLESYLTYKQRAFELSRQPLIAPEQQAPEYQLQQFEQAQQALKRLRRETLPPDAVEAFFGLEEAYGDFTLATIAIQQRDDLSAGEKRDLIRYERSRLPEVLRHTQKRVTESARQAREVEAVISNATSPAAAEQALREMGLEDGHVREIVGSLKRQEQFQAVYSEYSEARRELAQAGLSESDRARQLSALQERYFPDEQQRTWARLKDLDAAPSNL